MKTTKKAPEFGKKHRNGGQAASTAAVAKLAEAREDKMGCAGSKESDKTAAGARDVKEKYGEMAEDAASMLSGTGE